jgi:predicted aspartyl protease
MGSFTVQAIVWNPHNPEKRLILGLIVDTGATYTTLPASMLEKLGVMPIRVIRVRLADNRVVERLVGEIGIEIEGYRASATPVIFGNEGVYLLGAVTMEQLGLAPDPVEKRLKPFAAVSSFIRFIRLHY